MNNKENLSLYKFGIEERLINIWSNYSESNIIAPIYQECIPLNSVTFLSLNPSFNPKFSNTYSEANKTIYHYEMIDSNESPKHPHFKKFFEVGENIIPEQWASMDLLYIQNSNQKNIEKIKDNNFIIQQMKITFEIFSKINPRIVIVANRYVDFLIHKFSNELNLKMEQPSKENGYTYLINNIPFIIKESKFMGSRILWAKEQIRKENLNKEILRILNQIKNNNK